MAIKAKPEPETPDYPCAGCGLPLYRRQVWKVDHEGKPWCAPCWYAPIEEEATGS